MKIEDSIRKLYEALEKQKEVSSYVEAVKKKEYLAISNYIFTSLPKGTESFVVRLDDGEKFYMEPVTVRVTRVRKKSLIWNFEKLLYNLGRTRYEKVVKKTYVVNNMTGLTEYLKKCGVDPKVFKKYINVETKLDEDKLNTEIELGKVKTEEINNCYELKVGEPYFKLTKLK